MQTKHVFSNHIYLISSHSVARNPLFTNSALCTRFLEKLSYYLSPLCEIIQYSLTYHEFQLIIRLRNREKFCDYYRKKHGDKNIKDDEIPFSTYIFSQAVANLLASTAIHFNRRYKRTGALFARRFYRQLIRSERELVYQVGRLSRMENHINYTKRWRVKGRSINNRKWRRRMRKKIERTGMCFYEKKKLDHPILKSFCRFVDMDFQGQFQNLPKLDLYADFSRISIHIYIKRNTSPP